MKVSSFIGTATAVLLTGAMLVQCAQVNAIKNTEVKGASKDFADGAEMRLKAWEAKELRDSVVFDASGYPVESADQKAERLIQESNELQERSAATMQKLEEAKAKLNAVDAKIEALCSGGECPEGWENR